MKKNDGKNFEVLTAEIFRILSRNPNYEKVEHNIKLPGKDAPRQIDVLITTNVAGMVIRTIIECKDFMGKISVGKIDELHSKLSDVNANKGVIVSAAGFSSTAIKKAKRIGISLFTAHEAMSKNWEIPVEIPILVCAFKHIKTHAGYYTRAVNPKAVPDGGGTLVNDLNFTEEFAQYWRTLTLDQLNALKKNENQFYPSRIQPPYFVRQNGEVMEAKDLRITFSIEKEFYFGFLNEQAGSLLLRDVIDGKMDVLMPEHIFSQYEKNLRKIHPADIPDSKKIELTYAIQIPTKIVEFHRN